MTGVLGEPRLFASGGSFLEGLRRHDGRWWASDFHRGVVLAFGTDGAEQEILRIDDRPSGLGWLPDGSLLVVAMDSRRILRRRPDGTVTVHADLRALAPGPLNDMVVDATGTAYVGEYGFELEQGAPFATGSVIAVAPDGAAEVLATDLWFPNGAVVAGGELVVGESFAGRYTAISLDGRRRRTWARLAPPPSAPDVATIMSEVAFMPDGCALDADGHLWSCDSTHQRACLVAEGGEILAELAAPPGMQYFACALGPRELLLSAGPPFGSDHAGTRDSVLLTVPVAVGVPGAKGR